MATLIDGKFTEEELDSFVSVYSLDDEELAEELEIDEDEIDNNLELIKEKGYGFWAKNTLTANHSGWINTKVLTKRGKEIFEYLQTLA